MQKTSDNTDALKEKESKEKTLEWDACKAYGEPKDPGWAEKQTGELWSGRRVGGPHRVGGGCRGKRLSSEAVPASHTCARGSQLRTSQPEAQSSRGGGGAERLERKGLL